MDGEVQRKIKGLVEKREKEEQMVRVSDVMDGRAIAKLEQRLGERLNADYFGTDGTISFRFPYYIDFASIDPRIFGYNLIF